MKSHRVIVVDKWEYHSIISPALGRMPNYLNELYFDPHSSLSGFALFKCHQDHHISLKKEKHRNNLFGYNKVPCRDIQNLPVWTHFWSAQVVCGELLLIECAFVKHCCWSKVGVSISKEYGTFKCSQIIITDGKKFPPIYSLPYWGAQRECSHAQEIVVQLPN